MATRREFRIHACQGVSLVSIAAALQACGGDGNPTGPPSTALTLPTIAGTVINGSVVLTIDATSPLSAVGSAALVQTSVGNFLVAHPAQGSFTAVTAVCTHQGCTVTGFENQIFVCPCHGSRYTTSGVVVMGPAPAPLRQFATQFANDVLTIVV